MGAALPRIHQSPASVSLCGGKSAGRWGPLSPLDRIDGTSLIMLGSRARIRNCDNIAVLPVPSDTRSDHRVRIPRSRNPMARQRDPRSVSAHRISTSIRPVHREGDDTPRLYGSFDYCEPTSSARGRHRDAGGRFPVRLFSRRAGAASVAGGIIPCCRRGWDESCLATKS